MQLVYMSQDKDTQLYTTHNVIAKSAEIDPISIRKLIDKHKKELEEFGKVSFEMTKIKGGRGRKSKIYHLNEQQATLLITWLDNTQPVRAFKLALVKAFYEMREELTQFKLQRALEKPLRVSLTDAIKQWEYAKPYSYKHFTDLLLKATTGRNAKQLKQERGTEDSISLDLLNADELTTYQQYETMLIGMVLLGYQYEVIKNTVLGDERLGRK